MSGAWVYIGMPMCRVGKTAAQRHGGMVADQMTRWRFRWHCATVVHQVARWCQGVAPGLTATRLRHVGGRWHSRMVWQVGRCDGGSMARSPEYVTARKHSGTVKWWHGGSCDQVHGAMETRSPYKCSSYAHIVLRIIFQIFLLILNLIIISFLSDLIILYGTMQ